MSLTARLHIEGHTNEEQGIPILSCDYGFHQDIGPSGEIMTRVMGGVLNLTVRGLDDEELFTWMVAERSLKRGRISFSGVTSTGPGRRIEFEDGILVRYHESFANESDITIQLVISARRISLFGVNHDNMWTRNEDQG